MSQCWIALNYCHQSTVLVGVSCIWMRRKTVLCQSRLPMRRHSPLSPRTWRRPAWPTSFGLSSRRTSPPAWRWSRAPKRLCSRCCASSSSSSNNNWMVNSTAQHRSLKGRCVVTGVKNVACASFSLSLLVHPLPPSIARLKVENLWISFLEFIMLTVNRKWLRKYFHLKWQKKNFLNLWFYGGAAVSTVCYIKEKKGCELKFHSGPFCLAFAFCVGSLLSQSKAMHFRLNGNNALVTGVSLNGRLCLCDPAMNWWLVQDVTRLCTKTA